MGTPASITIKTKEGRYESIRVNYDGYPDHTLAKLQEFYNSYEKAEELIALGNLSVLKDRLAPDEGEHHDFNNSAKDVTIAYGRDRGERGQQARYHKNWGDVDKTGYDYIFSGGKWDVMEHADLPEEVEEGLKRHVAGALTEWSKGDLIESLLENASPEFFESYRERYEENKENEDAEYEDAEAVEYIMGEKAKHEGA